MSVNLNKSPTELLDNVPLTKEQREKRHEQYQAILKTLRLSVEEAKETEYGLVNHNVIRIFKYKMLWDYPDYLVDIEFLQKVLYYIGYVKDTVVLFVRDTSELRREINSSRNSKCH